MARGLSVLLLAGGAAGCADDPRPTVQSPSPAVEGSATLGASRPGTTDVGDSIAGTADTVLTGTLTYRQRIALPRDAVVVVSLLPAGSGGGAPIAERRFAADGQVPIRFELPYDSSRLQAGRSYAVRARILVDGAPWFVNEPPAALPAGGAPLQIVLQMAPDPAG